MHVFIVYRPKKKGPIFLQGLLILLKSMNIY
jgi:hypothetical protein